MSPCPLPLASCSLLYMGDRIETDEVNEELAAQQVETWEEECDKGWFEDFDESMIITIIGSNTTNQNALVAQVTLTAHRSPAPYPSPLTAHRAPLSSPSP